MKKIVTTLMIAGLALSFASCQKELENAATTGPGDAVVLTLNATHEVDTKTVLNGTTPKWAAGDKVTVMYKKTGESSWSSSISGEASSKDSYVTATFSTELTSPDGDQAAYAIYPANNLSQNVADKAKITIASTQHPTGTSFDGASDILISKSFNPTTSPVTTQFARLGAVLKISIDNATLASEKLVSLSVEGANPLAGDVLVGLSDKTVKDIENGSNTVTAEYETANQFELGSGKYVYLIVNPQTLVSGSHLIINGVTRNYTFTKDIILASDIDLSSGHIRPLNITISSITLTAKKDVIDYDATGLGTSGSYTTWSDVDGSVSDAVYEGRSYPNASNYIQMNGCGIVSTTSGGAITKVSVVWNSKTSDDRTLTVYGKNTSYSGQDDLSSSPGTELGTIVYGTSTYLNIDGYYEYIGIYANKALYLDEVDFYWVGAKSATGLVWKKSGVKATTDDAQMKTGDDILPTISLDNPNSLSLTYSSSDPSVATINEITGVITLVGAGSTVISAAFAGDETYRPDTQKYTLTVTDNRSTCATPSFSVSPGAVEANTVVRISSDTPNATIYYKIDSEPTTTVYDGVSSLKDASDKPYIDITIDVAKTIYAIAVKEDWQNGSANATYTISGVFTPVVVWDDDFSQFDSASTTALTSLSGSKTGFKNAYSGVSTVYPEASAIKFASGSNAGSITTPVFSALSSTSKVSVTIKAVGMNAKTGPLNFTVNNAGTASISSSSVTASTKANASLVEDWDTITFTITGATSATSLTISAAKSKQVFVDSIYIVTIE